MFGVIMNEPEKMEALCPECGTKNLVIWFPSNKSMIDMPGTRSGKTSKLRGRGEKVEGKCECGYKFKPDDLD